MIDELLMVSIMKKKFARWMRDKMQYLKHSACDRYTIASLLKGHSVCLREEHKKILEREKKSNHQVLFISQFVKLRRT